MQNSIFRLTKVKMRGMLIIICFVLLHIHSCDGKHKMYVLNNAIRSGFTNLVLEPYSGIQECLEACNDDEQCDAIGMVYVTDRDEVACYIKNGSGNINLSVNVEVRVKDPNPCSKKPDQMEHGASAITTESPTEDISTKNTTENVTTENTLEDITTENTTNVTTESTTEDVTTESTTEDVTTVAARCPSSFMTSLNSSTGCYYSVPHRLSWNDAEAECQRHDQRAHLISLDSDEVRTCPAGFKHSKIFILLQNYWLSR